LEENKTVDKFQKIFCPAFGAVWPILAQNTPKHAYFQKLEENKTLSKKNRKIEFLAHFLPFFSSKMPPKNSFFKKVSVALNFPENFNKIHTGNPKISR